MRASELTIIHSKSSQICLAIQNTQIDGNLTENRLHERYSVGSIISGSPEVLHTTTQ